MSGVTNSWIEQYTNQPTPCINDVQNTNDGSFSSCLMWLFIGVIIGSLSFEKKGKTA